MQPDRHDICQTYLDELAAATPEIMTAVVTTEDGFEVAAMERGAVSHSKLSAMTSAMLALGHTMVAEGKLENCLNVIVEADTGHIFMLAIPDVEGGLLLNVIADRQITMGRLLWASKRCCEQIRAGLSHPR